MGITSLFHLIVFTHPMMSFQRSGRSAVLRRRRRKGAGRMEAVLPAVGWWCIGLGLVEAGAPRAGELWVLGCLQPALSILDFPSPAIVWRLRKINEPYVKDFALKQKIFNALGLSVVAAVGVENAVVSSGLDNAVVSLGKQGGLFIHGFGVLAKWQQQDAVVRAARWDALMCPGPQMGPCSANPLPSVSCPTDLHPCWADIPQATGFSRPPACCELKPQNEALLAGFPAVLCSAASLNPSELLSGMETLTFWENVD